MSELNWKRAFGDLSQKVKQNETTLKERSSYDVEESFRKPPCYWKCILQNDIDGALSDWEPEYFQDTTTRTVSYRIPFRQCTGGGELLFPHPNGGSGYGARFAKITVYALQPQTVLYALGLIGSSSICQLKVNGLVTVKTGSADNNGSIELAAGYNTISIATNESTDSLQFWCLLFDGQNVFWVDPADPRYPSRDGFSQGGFGGLPPSSQPEGLSGSGSS